MNHYYLFLDESKPNAQGTINHLCLGGIIVEKDIYERNLVVQVNKLKQEVFTNTSVILHESHIRDCRKGDFEVLKKHDKRTELWDGLVNIFENNDFKVVAAAIHEKDYTNLYTKKYLNDKYFITMQIILENFVHFLEVNNGTGTVYIESRDAVSDKKLKNLYHKIVANGTLFYNANIFQDRLVNINFNSKTDNIIGLQIADLIPGPLNRECNGLKKKNPSLYTQITSKFYDGNCGNTERFGFKIMP